MAITFATVTGKITRGDGTTPIPATVTAHPMTTDQALTFGADNVIGWGTVVTKTDKTTGALTPPLQIPLNSDLPGVLWRIIVKSDDRRYGLGTWTLGTFEITANTDLADLVDVDVMVVPANTPAEQLTDLALKGRYVRIEDLSGNSLNTGTVVIKVDTANGNAIDDIVWEA